MTTTTTATTAPVRRHGRAVLLASAGVLAGAGLAAGLVLGFGGTGAPSVTPASPTSTSVPAGHHAVVPSGGSGHHVTPVAPSAAVETLQRELGQLNYYEGPVTGTMTPQTVQAVRYLQRDAHLPQTGTLNAATRAALAHFLADGNNQMAG